MMSQMVVQAAEDAACRRRLVGNRPEYATKAALDELDEHPTIWSWAMDQDMTASVR